MSVDGSEYSLHNIMSNLAMRVGAMEGTVKTFMDNWARQDQLAHEGRRLLYERVDLISRQVERIATDVENIQQDVAEMKKEIEEDINPTIEMVEKAKERKLGAKGVWAMVGAAIMTVASALAYIADKIAAYIFPKP